MSIYKIQVLTIRVLIIREYNYKYDIFLKFQR